MNAGEYAGLAALTGLLLVLVPALASAGVYIVPNEYGDIIIELGVGDVEWNTYSHFDSVSVDQDANAITFVSGGDTFVLMFVPTSDARMVVTKFAPMTSIGTVLEFTIKGSVSYYLSLSGLPTDGIYHIESGNAYSDYDQAAGGVVSFEGVTAQDGEFFTVSREYFGNPRANIEASENGWNKVQFTYRYEGDADIVLVQWNFGDGNGSHDISPVHQYRVAGTYAVTLILYDEFGNAGYVTEDIVVGDPAADQSEAYMNYWLNERAAGAAAVIIISILLAALYVYVADKRWGGAQRVLPVAVVAMGFIIALLVYGGNW